MAQTSASSTNHYLQSEAWAEARRLSPWQPTRVAVGASSVYVYQRASGLGKVLHIPGYSLSAKELTELTDVLRQTYPYALTCKLETCLPYDESLEKQLQEAGWRRARPTQYAYTVQLDLTKSTDMLRAEMKKRARNELNRAVKNGVHIREATPDDEHLQTMYDLLARTAAKQQFSIHENAFTFQYWHNMIEVGKLRLFFAEHEGLILAAAVVLLSPDGTKAWYKEGASTDDNPTVNAPRLLLWEIAQELQKSGVKTFDLGGIPDPATYEVSSMRGIYIFKTAYTTEVTKMMPAYELPLSPMRYKLWPKLEVYLRKQAQMRHDNWY